MHKSSLGTGAAPAENEKAADACWNAFLAPDPAIKDPGSALAELFKHSAYSVYSDLIRWGRKHGITPEQANDKILYILEAPDWRVEPESKEKTQAVILSVYETIALISLQQDRPGRVDPSMLDYTPIAVELSALKDSSSPEDQDRLGFIDKDWPSVAALSMSGTARVVHPPIDVPVALCDEPANVEEWKGYLCSLRLDIIETTPGEGSLLGYHPEEIATRRFRIDERARGGALSFSQGLKKAWEVACRAAGRSDVCARWSLHPLSEKEPMPEMIDGASFSAAAARAWTLMLQAKKVDTRLLVSAQIGADEKFHPVGGIRQKTTRLTEILRDLSSNCQIDRIAVVGQDNLDQAEEIIRWARLQDRLDAVRIDVPVAEQP